MTTNHRTFAIFFTKNKETIFAHHIVRRCVTLVLAVAYHTASNLWISGSRPLIVNSLISFVLSCIQASLFIFSAADQLSLCFFSSLKRKKKTKFKNQQKKKIYAASSSVYMSSTQNSELRTQNSKLKTQNSKLKTQNSKLKTQNSKLKTQNSKLKTQNSKLKTQNS